MAALFNPDENLVKGGVVNLTADIGQVQTPATDNGDGTYTATYTAVKQNGPVKITAVTNTGQFTTVTLELVELDISKDKSTLQIAGSAAVQTGVNASVVVVLKTVAGLPVSGRKVDLKVEPADKVIIDPVKPTDADGQTVITFRAGTPGVKMVTAKVGDMALTASVAVIYSGAEVEVSPS